MPDWTKTFDSVRPYVVMIEDLEDDGKRGSGFFSLGFTQGEQTYDVIATAAHVMDDADEQKRCIRIMHPSSRNQVDLQHGDYRVSFSETTDLALIFIKTGCLPAPRQTIPITQITFDPGHQVGWCGFPHFAGAAASHSVYYSRLPVQRARHHGLRRRDAICFTGQP